MKNEIFGVEYDNFTFSEALETVRGYLSQLQKRMVLFLNADYLYKALHDESYAKILSEADLVLPDGVGLRVLSSLKGKRMSGNCNGTDLTPEVLKIAIEKKLKVFFLGGKREVSDRASVNLPQWFPGLDISGMYSGYFSDDNAVVEQINSSGTDILIVSMGAPYQEKWVYRNWPKLKPRLCLAVGGWIDYPGERLKRAPLWMRRMNLEWVGRIVQDPGQMINRYWRSFVFLTGMLIRVDILKRSVSMKKSHVIVSVMNVHYNNMKFHEAVAVTNLNLDKAIRMNIFFLNADCVYKAQKDVEYRDILRSSEWVLPDGIGLKLISKLFGYKMLDNCNGTEFSPVVLQLAAQKGLSVYFLGSKEGVAQKAAEAARRKFQGVKIAGYHSGFFHNDDQVIDDINKSGADILFVGMGAPLQEKWIVTHRQQLRPRLCLGVGAYLNFLSGQLIRAPKWMISLHLEWFWRVLVEPRRMFKRYFIDGARLFFLVFKYRVLGSTGKCSNKM